jgi:hypothetical protein
MHFLSIRRYSSVCRLVHGFCGRRRWPDQQVPRILAAVAALFAVVPAHAIEVFETRDCANQQCTKSLPPMAFCRADLARRVLGEDSSMLRR